MSRSMWTTWLVPGFLCRSTLSERSGGLLTEGGSRGRISLPTVAISAHGRRITDRVVVPIGQLLVRVHVTANALTTIGLLGTIAGLAVILAGYPFAGAATAAAAAVLDALDGTVARLTGTQSQLGSFYDSVSDRVSDVAIFSTAAWIVRDDPVAFTVVSIALGSALVTSYIRAKAESLGWDASVGIVERPERVILMLSALGLGFVELAAWLLAAGGLVTIAQRLLAVVRQSRAASEPRP